MAKYEVTKAWNGVTNGQIIEMDKLHPSLKSNVRKMPDEVQLTPATPGAKSTVDKKGVIAKRLKELDIEFDGRKGADELAQLLPDDELEKLFPED